jgi:hypothetical protein
MQKVLGSHKVKGKTMAVLECGHEVDYGAVKWPEGMAECKQDHAPVIVALEPSVS